MGGKLKKNVVLAQDCAFAGKNVLREEYKALDVTVTSEPDLDKKPAEEKKSSYVYIIASNRIDPKLYQAGKSDTINNATLTDAIAAFFDRCRVADALWAVLVSIKTKQTVAAYRQEAFKEIF